MSHRSLVRTTRAGFVMLGLAATLGMSACVCGADEERAVTVSAPDSLLVTRAGVARRVEFVTRLDQNQVTPSAFQYVFNTVEGGVNGEGIALTLSSTGATSDELALLVLALPASLRRGETYQVGTTFPVEAGIAYDPRYWGSYDLKQPDRAEVAFTVANYTFPPPQYVTRFRAATTTGTIRVTNRGSGRLELLLDLGFVDAGGVTSTVTGRVQVNSERYTPPCT